MIPKRNSGRNALKKIFGRRRKMATNGGSGGPAAVFFKDTKTSGNKWHNQKDFTQLSLKLRE